MTLSSKRLTPAPQNSWTENLNMPTRRALLELARRELDVNAESFAVWYTYAAGRNPDLNNAIEQFDKEQRVLDQAACEELYARFFTYDREEAQVSQSIERVEELLRGLTNNIGQLKEGTSNYDRCLSDFQDKLQEKDIGKLLEAIESIRRETSQIAQAYNDVELQLVQASQDASELQANLSDLKVDSNADALTGLANWKGFHSLLRREAITAAEMEKPLSLVIFDIDDFSRFNKLHGEQIGDQALKCVAKVLGSVLKGGATARYGGEEFAAVLLDTPLEEAIAQANEVRGILETHQLVSQATGKRYESLTVSAGVAQYEVGHPLVGMIERAESALKKAKSQGRNCVVSEG